MFQAKSINLTRINQLTFDMTSPDGLPSKQNVRWSTTPVSLFCRSADLHDFGGMFALPEKVTENVEQIRKLGDPSDPFGSLRTS